MRIFVNLHQVITSTPRVPESPIGETTPSKKGLPFISLDIVPVNTHQTVKSTHKPFYQLSVSHTEILRRTQSYGIPQVTD